MSNTSSNGPFQMRHRRSYSDSSRRGRRSARSFTDFSRMANRAQKQWNSASSSERSMFGLAALGVFAVASVAVNLLFHVSLALAFFVIPVVFAPVMLTLLASFSMFAILTFATAGAGFFFVGTPFLAMALLAKAFLPFAIVAGAAGFVAKRFLGWGSNDVDEEEEEVLINSDYTKDSIDRDAFERFDEKLGYTGTTVVRRTTDVTRWGLIDVIEELDNIGLGEYRQLFIEERIDGKTLLTLSDSDIKSEFGTAMPLGDRVRLSQLVSELRRRSSR